ncbi:MAG: SLBB domain-containing protein [Candidatus Neomarinimicrobiota bacterium]
MKKIKIVALGALGILCLNLMASAQTLEDIKLRIARGEISVEEAARLAQIQAGKTGTSDTTRGLSAKKGQAYSPVYLQDYINLSQQNLDLLGTPIPDSLMKKTYIDTVATEEELAYFGYDVFKRVPENFQQIQVGPVDPNYIIGPGDEIILSMWGATEQRYSLPVERDGTVYLEKAGQIVVNGYKVETLKKRLENILSKYYSTIKPPSGNPTTFIDISLGKLRPILVYVIGEVNQPGAYAQDAFSTVFGALLLSGGPAYSGSLRDIQIIRDNKVVANFDLYQFLLSGKKQGDIRLRNDDIIFVPHRRSTIYLKGEVSTPAVFELKPAETLRDLINYAGGLTSMADINRVEIERILPFEKRDKVSQVNRIIIDEKLGQSVKGKFLVNKVEIKDRDIITIFPVFDRLKNYVVIEGAVHQPGRYSFETVKSLEALVKSAQGLLPEAYLKQIQIKRTYPDLNTVMISLDISDKKNLNTKLMEWDSVRVYSIWDVQDLDSVQINGEVRKPGKYLLSENMTLKDVILMAGGFTKVAYNHSVEVFRADPAKADLNKLAMVFKVELKGDILTAKLEDDNFKLFDNDLIVVRSIPYFKYQQNVIITGEVKFPGTYSIIKSGETLAELVDRAGGLTSHAFLDGTVYTRGNRKLVADFEKVLSGRSKDDITIEPDDNILIPRHPQTVEVIGMVNSPGLQKYKSGQKAKDYIEQAGGYHRDADKGEVYVYHANGAAKKSRKCCSAKVTEGSKIIVGKKVEKEPLDITEFLKEVASITASVVTIIILVYSLNK